MVSTLPVTHEDLSDQLTLLDAEEMIFTSAIPKGPPAENTTFYFPVDKLDAPRLGGEVDHATVTRANVKNRMANRDKIPGCIQHFRETYGSSLIAQQVQNPAGIDSVLENSKFKTLVALKQKMELTFLSEQDQQAITSSLDGLTRGAVMWGRSSAQPNSSLAVPAAFRPASAQEDSVASAAAITEQELRAMLKNLRLARQKQVDVIGFCTLDFAETFDSFFLEQTPIGGSAVPIRSFNYDGESEIYQQMVTTYKTRNGKVTVMPTEYLNGVRDQVTGLTGDTTSGSAVISGIANMPLKDDGTTPALQPFTLVKGTGIPAGAYIVSVDSATQITISANATANGSDIAITLGTETHALFVDPQFWELRTNLVPSHKPLPEDGGGEDAFVEAIAALACTYPALIGRFYTA